MPDEKTEQEIQQRVREELDKIFSDSNKMIQIYQKRVTELEIFTKSVFDSSGWMSMAEAVKKITWAGKPVGRNKMFALLRNNGILRSGDRCMNEPYQKYVDLGYFKIVQEPWKYDGETFIGKKTVVSQRGLAFLVHFVNEVYHE